MWKISRQQKLLLLVAICIFSPLFACDKKEAYRVVLKYSEEDIVNFLMPYTWAEKNEIASKDQLVTISLSDPKISSRLANKKDREGYVISLWEKAQKKLYKTSISIKSSAYDEFRYKVFSDVMSRLLVPYIKGQHYTYCPNLDRNDRIICDCLCDLFYQDFC